MKINKLRLTMFRQIGERTYKFPAQFTAITGPNGAGKTTLLDALAVVLGIYVAGSTCQENAPSPRPIMPMDVKRIPVAVKDGQLDYNAYKYDAVVEASLQLAEQPMHMKCSLAKSPFDNYTNDLSDTGTQLFIKVASRVRQAVLPPIVAYFGSNRFNRSCHESAFDPIESQSRTLRRKGLRYLHCLTLESGIKRLQYQYQLLRREGYLTEVEPEIDGTRMLQSDRQFSYIELLKQFVPNWKPSMFFRDKNIREDEDVSGLYALPGEEDIYLAYKMLSDGERSILGIVSDIAFRCLMTENALPTENIFATTKGVILIDELEKSLHPEWQKRIVDELKAAFPSMQFIVTTLSPYILQSLQRDEILNLLDILIDTDPFRMSIEDVSGEIMNVPDVTRSKRFTEMVKVAEKYYQLVREGRTSTNDAETASLRSQLNEMEALYGTDPAFVALLKAKRNNTI